MWIDEVKVWQKWISGQDVKILDICSESAISNVFQIHRIMVDLSIKTTINEHAFLILQVLLHLTELLKNYDWISHFNIINCSLNPLKCYIFLGLACKNQWATLYFFCCQEGIKLYPCLWGRNLCFKTVIL